jgi:hypothetical protein
MLTLDKIDDIVLLNQNLLFNELFINLKNTLIFIYNEISFFILKNFISFYKIYFLIKILLYCRKSFLKKKKINYY